MVVCWVWNVVDDGTKHDNKHRIDHEKIFHNFVCITLFIYFESNLNAAVVECSDVWMLSVECISNLFQNMKKRPSQFTTFLPFPPLNECKFDCNCVSNFYVSLNDVLFCQCTTLKIIHIVCVVSKHAKGCLWWQLTHILHATNEICICTAL